MGGTANVALRVAASAPCAYAGGANPACQAIFAPATPPAMFGAGNAFGFSTQAAGAAPSPGRYYVTVNPLGTIVGITATGLGPGLPNPATSWGGPWTTGMLTVSQPASVPPGIFVLSGTDARVPPLGTGSISLVSGAISVRGLSGPNANRGWLNLSVGPVLSHVPVMPVAAMIALIAAIAVSGAFFLRWRARPEAADRQSDAAGGGSDRR
jgi:hypothetical protein